MYAGNIGHPTDVETIIDAAELLHDDPSAHFVFVGSGAKKAWIDREVKERGLSNVSLLGQRPREEQNVFLNACDIGLVALVPGMIGTAMPSRTYNILAAGKPIIALTEPGSELSKVIDEERVGWHIIPRHPEALVRTIKKARADTSQLNEMGSRARAVAVEKYSPAIAVGKYADALRS
jgi:glycosyltransferase involved in cell wall biosynthesis